jgi:hypothetical protein
VAHLHHYQYLDTLPAALARKTAAAVPKLLFSCRCCAELPKLRWAADAALSCRSCAGLPMLR